MTSRSSSSTPSEGEIVESDSDKATTSLHMVKDNHVNPTSRLRVSISQSPSPIHSPKSYRSRTRSRSPYREPKGSKRIREDDHYNDRSRGDTRRFKVRYEDRPFVDRKKLHGPSDLDRSRGPDPKLSYDDRYPRHTDKKHRVRSRSPYSKSLKPSYARYGGSGRDYRLDGHGWHDHDRRRGEKEGRSRLSREQSVSDRGHSPIATASSKQKAETKYEQKHHSERLDSIQNRVTAKYVLRFPRVRQTNRTFLLGFLMIVMLLQRSVSNLQYNQYSTKLRSSRNAARNAKLSKPNTEGRQHRYQYRL